MKKFIGAEAIRAAKAKARDHLDMLYARGKHNVPHNICAHDVYFAASLKREYEVSDLGELERWANS